MRTYGILVNADLVDELNLSLDEWQELHNWVHFILECEYYCQVTGAISSAVKDRASIHFRDFI